MERDPPAADPFLLLCLFRNTDHVTYGSSLLAPEELSALEGVLQKNEEVFAWTHSNMPRIHPSIASHRLNIMSSSRPIWQKVRHFHLDRQKIIQTEVDKLLTTGFVREVEYPNWLVNVVVVPKNGEKW